MGAVPCIDSSSLQQLLQRLCDDLVRSVKYDRRPGPNAPTGMSSSMACGHSTKITAWMSWRKIENDYMALLFRSPNVLITSAILQFCWTLVPCKATPIRSQSAHAHNTHMDVRPRGRVRNSSHCQRLRVLILVSGLTYT